MNCINTKKYIGINTIILTLIIVLVSRGVLELFIPKTVCYIVQLIAWIFFIKIVSFKNKIQIKISKYYGNLNIFIILTLISYMYTILYKSVYSGVIYTFSMIWITFAIYISNEGDYSTLNKVSLDIIISIIIIITG